MEKIKNSTLSNRISNLSYKHFANLPKTGKPTNKEWTVLATITQHDLENDNLEVVALGTGSKCIGKNKMSLDGDILNDSHAEIICRRAFLRYLYYQIDLALQNKHSIFEYFPTKCVLRRNITFSLFCTQIPCGDASIFPKSDNELHGQCLIENNDKKDNKRCINQTDFENKDFKRMKIDIYRTGAKCLEQEEKQDLHKEGIEYHTVGAVRRKPGRGDPTLSLSCSDKLARWIHVGVQGALLNLIVPKPIYFTSVIISGNTPCSELALKRALYDRFQSDIQLQEPFKKCIPEFSQSDIGFEFAKTDTKQPCPSSIIWCAVPDRPLEVAVNGKKQGVTKKNKNSSGELLICKKQLALTFITLIKKYDVLKNVTNCKFDETLNYLFLKKSAVQYQSNWKIVRDLIFKVWSTKSDDYLLFKVRN